MEIYLFILIILFILAISDLMVGVANDAVNFLNSAVGAKVAPRHIIMIVASLGILVGTTFSSGLMEVARKGIFNPELFFFEEIMIIFLAVMFTDVLLLDLFNTFALPTSTTVSIVFELLGAAVAVSAIKIINAGDGAGELIKYINSSKALAIISGILLSIVIAFSAGMIIQFLTRLIFTFDFERRIKRYGALWGGISLSAITFFILVKGAKGSSLLSDETISYILDNSLFIIALTFAFWVVVFQLLILFTKINILKPIVLAGTFALALAFAANDLVNFIGVPLAGLSSYKIALMSDDPFQLTMEALRGPVKTQTILLILAGGVMVVTLWYSKKSRSVTKTEVNLGRQDEGFERFESSLVARKIVRMNIVAFEIYRKWVPDSFHSFISKRFDNTQNTLKQYKEKDRPAFDLLRASVNLMVASILISFATSLKLPLSTTYVTFMVAMGTSLSDKAWGRESAVYRVNGVITVVGGWFFTAFMAFSVSALFAAILYFAELPAIIFFFIISGYIIYRTHGIHKRRSKEEEESAATDTDAYSGGKHAFDACMDDTGKFLVSVTESLQFSFKGLTQEDRESLKKSQKSTKKIGKQCNNLISRIFKTVRFLPEELFNKEHRYGKIIAALQEISANTKSISEKIITHIENNHKKPVEEQTKELSEILKNLNAQLNEANLLLSKRNFAQMKDFSEKGDIFKQTLIKFDENQIKRIKQGKTSPRLSLLYLSILADTENISDHTVKLISVCKKNFETLQKSFDN